MKEEDISVTMINGISFLPLPENRESYNVRILAPPEHLNINHINRSGDTQNSDIGTDIVASRCQVLGIKQHFWLHINSIIYKGMLVEMKKAKIFVDEDLKCMVNCIFTIGGRRWFTAPRELWKVDKNLGYSVPPTTFCIALRKDLM